MFFFFNNFYKYDFIYRLLFNYIYKLCKKINIFKLNIIYL